MDSSSNQIESCLRDRKADYSIERANNILQYDEKASGYKIKICAESKGVEDTSFNSPINAYERTPILNSIEYTKSLRINAQKNHFLTPQKKSCDVASALNERRFSSYHLKYKPQLVTDVNKNPHLLQIHPINQHKIQNNYSNLASYQDKSHSVQIYKTKNAVIEYQSADRKMAYLKPEVQSFLGSGGGVQINKFSKIHILDKTTNNPDVQVPVVQNPDEESEVFRSSPQISLVTQRNSRLNSDRNEEQQSSKSTDIGSASINSNDLNNRPSIDNNSPIAVFIKGPKINFISGPALDDNICSTAIKTEEELQSLHYLDAENSPKKENKSSRPLAITFLNNILYKQSNDFTRNKCSCDGYLKSDETCRRAKSWILQKHKEMEFQYLEEMYQKILLNDVEDESCTQQITKDLHRTFPKYKYFSQNGEGIGALERVLNAFAKYDPQLGYVQGMNFIAASLLYHAEEYLAFWLLVIIVENLEMRDVFLPNLPGLSKHCQIIDILIANHLPDIYELLCKKQIRMEFFASEWIFSLFAGVLPLDVTCQFYDKLFEQGWPFFYKVILAYLKHFEHEITALNEFTEIMILLKNENHLVRSSIDEKSKIADWNRLFQAALKIEVDSSFIYSMHANFDVETKSFDTHFLKAVTKERKSITTKL